MGFILFIIFVALIAKFGPVIAIIILIGLWTAISTGEFFSVKLPAWYKQFSLAGWAKEKFIDACIVFPIIFLSAFILSLFVK